MDRSRIELTDTVIDAVSKMSNGNPGAITAMMQIIDKHDRIDPQAAMGAAGAIMILDTWRIYGTDIYVLFSDKCGKDVRRMLMLMRATQLGFFSQQKLQQMASDQMREINLTAEEWADLDEKVCAKLMSFARPKTTNQENNDGK